MALEAAVRPEFLHRPESKIQRDTFNRIVAVTVVMNWKLKRGEYLVVSRNKSRRKNSQQLFWTQLL